MIEKIKENFINVIENINLEKLTFNDMETLSRTLVNLSMVKKDNNLTEIDIVKDLCDKYIKFPEQNIIGELTDK